MHYPREGNHSYGDLSNNDTRLTSRWLVRTSDNAYSKTNVDVRARTWAVKKAQGKKKDVAGMMMVRWMSEVTRLDGMRSARIRRTTQS